MKALGYKILVYRGSQRGEVYWLWKVVRDGVEIGHGEEREPIDALESAAVFVGFHLDYYPEEAPLGIVAEIEFAEPVVTPHFHER